MIVGLALILSASSTWVIPSGLRNSSSNISPGDVGALSFGIRTPFTSSIVIGRFYILRDGLGSYQPDFHS